MNQPLHVAYTLKNQKAFRQLLDRASSSNTSANASSTANAGGGGLNNIAHTTGGMSFSGPRSLTLPSVFGAASGTFGQNSNSTASAAQYAIVDLNARDSLGRTVLHKACSSLEPAALDYVRMLLNHPAINVNVQDAESRWTALHRALYAGNVPAAVLLLQRSDVDISIKDYEGYTAFDLYNSTVEGTKPNADEGRFDLFTWGANRNAALGHSDGNDRAFPELVSISRQGPGEDKRTGSARFYPVQAKNVSMAKLHTTVTTSESRGNLRLCGFGSGGRLGGSQNTQYALAPLVQLDNTIIAVALGQDHTLALTANHEILSWGLNRFAQLGYVIEPPSSSSSTTLSTPSSNAMALLLSKNNEEPIQVSPRKIVGLLRGKSVLGVAACRMASAAWTKDTVFTWGTNGGQLGYQEQVQVLPRAVPTIAAPVIDIALTDTAMACLMETKDVVCYANNAHFKISFPANAWPFEVLQPYHPKLYRPPQSGPPIVKITSCESTFAALTELGDVFTFTTPTEATSAGKGKWAPVKPQRIWALRKQMSAVTDVALGADGALILCTESGHVFVRSRNATKALAAPEIRRHATANLASSGSGLSTNAPSASGKVFKFQRIASLQRVVKVSTNSTGAYAALRADVRCEPVVITGKTLVEDMSGVRPFVVHPSIHSLQIDDAPSGMTSLEEKLAKLSLERAEIDDDSDEGPVDASIRSFAQLLGVLSAAQRSRRETSQQKEFEHEMVGPDFLRVRGADLVFRCGIDIPAHRVVIAARCPTLISIFEGGELKENKLKIKGFPKDNRIDVVGCQTMAILVVLQYLYTDDVPAFWDRRVGSFISDNNMLIEGIKLGPLREEVKALARLLRLEPLLDVVSAASQRSHKPTLHRDLADLFSRTQPSASASRFTHATRGFAHPLAYDVVIQLSDREVACHSAILRARSPLFASFLDDEEWTARRWKDGLLEVDFKHLAWLPMSFVFKFMYEGQEEEMFDPINFADTVDDYLDFVFKVLSCATELLLDRLILMCSSVILRHVTVMNVSALLADASYYHATDLIKSLQNYMAKNLECLLENRLIEDMDFDILGQLGKAIRGEQAKKLSVSRSSLLINQAFKKHEGWLKVQDFPQPIVRSSKAILAARQSPRLSPVAPSFGKPNNRPSPKMIPESPKVRMKAEDASGDDIFAMDDDAIPPLSLGSPLPPSTLNAMDSQTSQPKASSSPAWKAKSIPASKVDLKAIMAEAAQTTPTKPFKASADQKGKSRVVGFQPLGPSTSMEASPSRETNRSWGTIKPIPQSPANTNTAQYPTLGGSPPKAASPSTLRPPSVPIARKASGNLSSGPSTPTSVPLLAKRPSGSNLGPTIVPGRKASETSSKRQHNAGAAWTLPPVEPAPKPSASTSAGTVSFAAIQHQQGQASAKAPPKKSLLDIQKEEEDLQTELDFITWWSAEEERLRLQEEADVQALAPAPSQTSRRSRPSPAPKRSDTGSHQQQDKEDGSKQSSQNRKRTQQGRRKPAADGLQELPQPRTISSKPTANPDPSSNQLQAPQPNLTPNSNTSISSNVNPSSNSNSKPKPKPKSRSSRPNPTTHS